MTHCVQPPFVSGAQSSSPRSPRDKSLVVTPPLHGPPLFPDPCLPESICFSTALQWGRALAHTCCVGAVGSHQLQRPVMSTHAFAGFCFIKFVNKRASGCQSAFLCCTATGIASPCTVAWATYDGVVEWRRGRGVLEGYDGVPFPFVCGLHPFPRLSLSRILIIPVTLRASPGAVLFPFAIFLLRFVAVRSVFWGSL